MNPHYLANQLGTYLHPVLTLIIRSMHVLSPPRPRAPKFRISFGVLLAYATKLGVTASSQP
jgi:hypothetical protein